MDADQLKYLRMLEEKTDLFRQIDARKAVLQELDVELLSLERDVQDLENRSLSDRPPVNQYVPGLRAPAETTTLRQKDLPKSSKETPKKAAVQMDSSSSSESESTSEEDSDTNSDLSFMGAEVASPVKPIKALPVKTSGGRRGKKASPAKPKTPTKPPPVVPTSKKARNLFLASESTESDGVSSLFREL